MVELSARKLALKLYKMLIQQISMMEVVTNVLKPFEYSAPDRSSLSGHEIVSVLVSVYASAKRPDRAQVHHRC